MSPRMLSLSVVLGVSVLARTGSAETLQPSAEGAARPAFFAVSPEVPGAAFAQAPPFGPGAYGGGGTLQVRRYYKVPPPPPPVVTTQAPMQAPPSGPREPSSWLILRGGIFDADNVAAEDWTVGMKGVGKVGSLLRLGGTVDLHRRTNSVSTINSSYVDGSGNVVQTAVRTVEGESNLVPLMAVAEIMLPIPVLHPYIGIGGGWEFMYVEAFDYTTGFGYDANYGGPGWQVYAGADLAMSRRVRLNAEVFHNDAAVEREVFDPVYGPGYEERIEVGGVGARFGLSFAL